MDYTIGYKALFDRTEKAVITDCICTTMSLSNEEMLSILGCYCGVEKINKSNIDTVLERCKDRFLFYFDARKTDQSLLAGFNSASVTAAMLKMQRPAPTKNTVFHPKIVLVRVKPEEGESSYRLQVSSRNLTPGTDTFETGVQLVSRQLKENETPNHNLHELLDYLKPDLQTMVDNYFYCFKNIQSLKNYKQEFSEFKDCIKEKINSRELVNLLSNFIKEIENINQNNKKNKKNPLVGEKNLKKAKRYLAQLGSLAEDWKRLDWLSKELKNFSFIIPDMPESKTEIFVSGINDKDKTQKELELWGILKNEKDTQSRTLHILSPDYETKQDMIDAHNVYAPVTAALPKTHAKLYYLPDKKTVWLGSCNLSEAAMTGKNVECMVKITNVGGAVTYDEKVFTVFGTKCERINEEKKYEGNSNYAVCEKLAKFVQQTVFSGTDIINRTRNCSIEVSSTYKKGSEKIEFLPLGFPDNIQDNKDYCKTAWKEWGKNSYCFIVTSNNNPPTGMLRIKLAEKDQNGVIRTAETVVVFDRDVYQKIIDRPFTYFEFRKTPWLQWLMECGTNKDAENTSALFHERCDQVSKEAPDLKQTIKDYKRIFEAYYNKLYPKGENV